MTREPTQLLPPWPVFPPWACGASRTGFFSFRCSPQTSLWRISFPGMSRLLAVDEVLTPTIERTLVVGGGRARRILAPLAAASVSLVTVLLGGQWADAAVGHAACVPPPDDCWPDLGGARWVSVGHWRCVSSATCDARRDAVSSSPCSCCSRPSVLPQSESRGFLVDWSNRWSSSARRGGESVFRSLGRSPRRRYRPSSQPHRLAWGVDVRTARRRTGDRFRRRMARLLCCAPAWRRRQLLDTVSLVSRGMRGAFATGVARDSAVLGSDINCAG